MSSIVKSQAVEEERRVGRKAYKTKGKKKVTVEEEEIELDPWEEEGTLVGNFRGFDPVGEVASGEIVEDGMLTCLFPFLSTAFTSSSEFTNYMCLQQSRGHKTVSNPAT